MPIRWQVGDRIENRYEIHQTLGGPGKSGMGIVYICYDHQEHLPVAIKTFQEKFLLDQKARDSFTKEALTWIKLDRHKNIVKAYYVKNIEYRPYIFMEYVAGGNLDDWIETKQLDMPMALNFALQFCYGMDYAYRKLGLIHLDIKPGNILVTKDKTIKITDFGLAKSAGEAVKTTQPEAGYVLSGPAGTSPYMAPEQWRAGVIDTRADIYAFGIVLYQMVAGKYPYQVEKPWSVIHLYETPIPIKNIPNKLNSLISKCMEKDPAKRYKNFSELKEEISKIYFDLTGEKIIEPTPEELDAWELVTKGVALGNLGRYQEEIVCCDKALEINPRFATTWNNKGVALRNLGRYHEAIACYDKALEINPIDAEAWSNKGNALRDAGRYQEEIVCCDKALEINPRLAEAWLNKGVALRNLRRYQEAIACYDKALEINPGYAEAWYNKGMSLGSLGRYQEEIACYDKALERALEINTIGAAALYNKGWALYMIGKDKEAAHSYQKFIQVAPPSLYGEQIKRAMEMINHLKRRI